MKIAIRMDDITPDMDWNKFSKFKEILDANNIKPLIGIVPNNEDEMLSLNPVNENFWELMKQLQKEGWIIAQHGYNHVYKTKKMGQFPLNRLSEFSGLSYEEQFLALENGKKILNRNGIYTDFFMAPAHSYDKKTLKALYNLGFRNLTDGFGSRPYKYKNIVYYPISFKQSSTLKKQKGYSTFVVHTNTMNDKDFERYRKLLEERRSDFISFSEYTEVKPERRIYIAQLGEKIKALVKYCLVRLS